MRHFAENAYYSHWSGMPNLIWFGFGTAVEQGQYLLLMASNVWPGCESESWRGNAASAMGVEDPPSNQLGAIFGDWAQRTNQQSLSETLRRFLEWAQVGNPQDAMSFNRLPRTEQEWQRWRLEPDYKLETVEGAKVQSGELSWMERWKRDFYSLLRDMAMPTLRTP